MTTTQIIIEVLGFLAMGLNIWGNILLARLKTGGWFIRLACNGIWMAVGVLLLSPSIIANSAVFTGINIYGIRKWRAERRKADEWAKKAPTFEETRMYSDGLIKRDVQ